ncbi:MAG: prepilin-type N-terminal cleavage/methylation domain-containing protein [Planctomycetaceae bacterium]
MHSLALVRSVAFRRNKRLRPALARSAPIRSDAGSANTLRRPAFTLFEMILVLAIVAAAVAIAWPSITWLYRRRHLEQGAEFVRAKMSSARVHAVESGVPYQFRFEPGGKRFIVIPFDPELLVEAAAQGSAQKVAKAAGTLSGSARFEGGNLFTDKGSEIPDGWLAGLPNGPSYMGAKWSDPVVFYPDGTAMQGDFYIRDDHKREVRLSVRSLTGAVRVHIGEEG